MNRPLWSAEAVAAHELVHTLGPRRPCGTRSTYGEWLQRCGLRNDRLLSWAQSQRCVLCYAVLLPVSRCLLDGAGCTLSVARSPSHYLRCPSHANLYRSAEDAVYVKKMASFYKRAKSEEEKLEARMVAAMARFAHVASRSGQLYSGPVPHR